VNAARASRKIREIPIATIKAKTKSTPSTVCFVSSH
jgi:hypothetical protein